MRFCNDISGGFAFDVAFIVPNMVRQQGRAKPPRRGRLYRDRKTRTFQRRIGTVFDDPAAQLCFARFERSDQRSQVAQFVCNAIHFFHVSSFPKFGL